MKRILILLIIGEKVIQNFKDHLGFVLFSGVLSADEGEDSQDGSSLTNNQEKLRKVLKVPS